MDEMRLRDLNAEAAESMARSKESDKLDYFAGCALSGLLAGCMEVPPGPERAAKPNIEAICREAYDIGKKMMKERDKR